MTLERPLPHRFRALWLPAIVLSVLGWGVAATLHAARYFLLADDHALVADAQGSLASIFTTGLFGVYRPLGFVVAKLVWLVQPSSAALSAAVLALHAVNAACVGLVARRLGYQPMAAASAAALFLWSPWGSEAYLWSSGIFDVGAAFGILLASLVLTLSAGSPLRMVSGLVLTVACCLLAAVFKENGYLAALIVPALALSGTERPRYVHAGLTAALAGACAAVVFLYRASLLAASHTPYSASEFGGRLISLEVLPAAASNLRALLLWPMPAMWGDASRILSMVVVWPVGAALTGSMVVLALRNRRAWALLIATALCLAPTAFYVINVETITPRRYLYLAGVPLCLLVGRAIPARRMADLGNASFGLTATVGSLLLAAGLSVAAQVGLWRQVTTTARCAVSDFGKQVLGRPAHPIYVENMPFAVDHGPFILLEYDFRYAYPQQMAGMDVAFRRTVLTLGPGGQLLVSGHGEATQDAATRVPVSLSLCLQGS